MTTTLRSSLHGLGLDDATMKGDPNRGSAGDRGSGAAAAAAETGDGKEEEDRIIVGIDFGTTHSAIAWAHTSTPEEYEVITQWPGQTGKDWGKVPSDIAYTTTTTITNSPSNRTSTPSLNPQRNSNSSSSNPRNSATSRANSPLPSLSTSRPASTLTPATSVSPVSADRSSATTPAPTTTTSTTTFKWGFEVSPTDPGKLSWIKILLDPSQPRPNFVQPMKTTLPKGKKPVDIVTDYLGALRGYTLLTLERRLGKEVLENTKVEYVLTVPAVWSDKARQMTMEAAIRAGLGLDTGSTIPESAVDSGVSMRSGVTAHSSATTTTGGRTGLLRLITEPEGAAEYALRSIRPNSMKVGDCFTVCDAGGGTVDLISYRISSLLPLQLNEVAVGSGALCGAVYLDRRFQDFVSERITKEVFEGMPHRAKFQMMQYWETYVKREFTAGDEAVDGDAPEGEGEDEEFWIPVMGVASSEERGVRDNFLRVTRKEVQQIFEPIVSQVLDLLSHQVAEVLQTKQGPVGAILLVGGFGSSEYLYSRIRRWSNSNIPVLQPRNAWTAVVRGAIIRGLQGDIAAVQSRLSRRHYGVVHDSRYNPAVHREDEKRWHTLRGEYVVRNRMQWYIKRGDITTDSKVISFPFYRTIEESDVVGGCHVLKTELWVCDAVVPPEKRDGSVRKLAVMRSEPVGVERFLKMRNSEGKEFWRVDYRLEMMVTGGIVVYEMRLEGDGGSVGRVEVRYE